MFGTIEEGLTYIFYGKKGSGKTTAAVSEILRFHKNGNPVWVNFPIVQTPSTKGGLTLPAPILREDDPAGLLSMGITKLESSGEYTSMAPFGDPLGPAGGLFVIDEAYQTLNSRKWADLNPETFLGFTHGRKLHMTVIIIAQSYMRIDKSIREVCDKAREHHGIGLFGFLGGYTEYDVDELGDIIKAQPSEYVDHRTGKRWINKKAYKAFDTDHLFGHRFKPRTWKSAIVPPPAWPASPSPKVAPRDGQSWWTSFRAGFLDGLERRTTSALPDLKDTPPPVRELVADAELIGPRTAHTASLGPAFRPSEPEPVAPDWTKL